ncbi:MAG: DNA-binding response regulator, partial [Acidobacteria bacterium]
MEPRSVLVVEDEKNIRDLVCLHLDLEGYECVAVADGREAMLLAGEKRFDLIILDVMLPGVDGVTITRAIRRHGPNRDVPILMLTARREEADKVMGLDSGADDYLTKPFGVRELVARAAALLRRARAPIATGDVDGRPVSIRGVELDPSRRGVRVRGQSVDVTRQEFNLLYV